MSVTIIDDTNYLAYVNDSLARGHVAGCLPRVTEFGGLACAAPMVEHIKPFPKSEWEDRIKAMTGRFPGDLMRSAKLPCKDQNGLNYCWAYSLASSIEALRVIEGQPYVELAPESLGGDVGYRNAGNSLDSAIAYAAEHGICDRSFVPSHAINTAKWTQGWKTEALNHRPAEWWDIGATDMWAETVTALLCGVPVYVGLDWWSHAIMYTGLRILSGEIVVEFRNSWGSSYGDDGYAVLKGSKKIPSLGCFAPRSTTFSNR